MFFITINSKDNSKKFAKVFNSFYFLINLYYQIKSEQIKQIKIIRSHFGITLHSPRRSPHKLYIKVSFGNSRITSFIPYPITSAELVQVKFTNLNLHGLRNCENKNEFLYLVKNFANINRKLVFNILIV